MPDAGLCLLAQLPILNFKSHRRPSHLFSCCQLDLSTRFEQMQALHDVVKAGYVRYVGMYSCYAWQCSQNRLDYAINNKLTPFISMQDDYNMLYREEEREMFPTLKYFGVGAIPWPPLATGALTRPLEREQRSSTGKQPRLTLSFQLIFGHELKRSEEARHQHGTGLSRLGDLGQRGRVNLLCVSAPIVGTTSLSNLADILAAIHIKLTEGEVKYLEEPYQPTDVMY
ncbi:Aldo/keto reductase [Mycena maculata]|uniref:Aldo/keto reductase n=1 Tax=Mycena maculata TaxID=230809 RepID=A0AAD7KA13_9AGAR|nr:Aldo/keto reductase [Mycena maculata]